MSRRKKKQLNNRAKVLIAVVLIAICLFTMHKFDLFTKSEELNKTMATIKFNEYGKENVQEQALEVLEEKVVSSNDKVAFMSVGDISEEEQQELTKYYVVLPEKVNGYYVEKYLVDSNIVIPEEIEKSDNDTNTLTSTNTVIDIENTVGDITPNNTINENTETDNEVTNETTNTTIQNNDNTISLENTISDTVENSAIQSPLTTASLEDTNIDEEKDEEETNTVNNVVENTVTNTITNSISNTVTNTTVENTTNTTVENTIIDSVVNEPKVDAENTPLTTEKSETESTLVELQPGEKFYIRSTDIGNATAAIDVVYDTLESGSITLYNAEITADLGTSKVLISGYVPYGSSLSATAEDKNTIKNEMADLDEFVSTNVVWAYDLVIKYGDDLVYQPKDHNQASKVTIISDELKPQISKRALGVVHIDETNSSINYEKIALVYKGENNIEFVTNEFSPYVLLEYPPIQKDSVTVYDYESDKNYYIGKNYTDGMAGYNQNKYTDDNLIKVNVNYYSYDPQVVTGTDRTMTISNVTASVGTRNDNGGYRHYPVTFTVNSSKTLNPTKGWSISFNAPTNFSAARTLAQNNGVVSNVEVVGNKVTITGNNFDAWTNIQTYESYSRVIQICLSGTSTTISSLSGMSATAVEKDLIGYVSTTERQTLFSYIKCLPKDSNNNVSIELIDNPYMDRPAAHGFNGWKTHEGYTITTNNLNKVQTLVANTNGAKEISVNVYVDWAKANYVFLNADTPTATASSNNGYDVDSPKRTVAQVKTVFLDRYNNTSAVSSRELNIIVLTGGNVTDIATFNGMGVGYTLTSIYDGVDYTDDATFTASANLVCGADFQLHHIRFGRDGVYSLNTNSGDFSYRLIGNTYNVRLGRGIENVTNATNCGTFAQVQGGRYNNRKNEYRLVVESGRYSVILLGRANGSSLSDYNTTGVLVVGSDIDRISGYNDGLNVYTRVASKTGNTQNSTSISGKPVHTTIIKSGNIGIQNFSVRGSSYAYCGLYVGGLGNADYDGSDRIAIVEGGNVANINGGLAVQSGSSVKTYTYVKGGSVQNIVGGAGVSQTYGDRIVQVTGGSVAYSVSGGSNGYLADTNSSTGDNGRMNGNTLVYVGGNAKIGTEGTGSTLYEVVAGSVMGAGNGSARYSENSGRVFGSHVIIDGEAEIYNSVFGGGNYGVVGQDVSVEQNPRVTFTNQYLNIEANRRYIIATGTTNNSNSVTMTEDELLNETISTYEYPKGSQEWFFEDAGNGRVYIKNAATGMYLGTNYNRNTVITEQPQTAFSVTSASANNRSVYISASVSGRTNYLRYYYGDWYFSSSRTALYLMTYNKIAASSDGTPLATKTKVDVFGGNVEHNVYGGPNRNNINGTVEITMTGGHIKGTLFGGSCLEGTIYGGAQIDVSGGTIGNSDTNTDVLFGGGEGAATVINQITRVNVTDASNNTNLYGNIYGGSALGTVLGSSVTNVSDTKSETNSILLTGDIYGGGKGSVYNAEAQTQDQAAMNSFYVTVNVDGGTYSSSRVFGGCNINGAIFNNVNVNIGEHYPTTVKEVYGGGNNASITQDTTEVIVNIYQYATVDNAFNGGNNAGIEGNNANTPRAINIKGAKINECVYGGSNSNGPLTETHVNCTDGATIGSVYGGGYGTGAIITSSTDVNITGCSILSNVYGGGNAGEVRGPTDVDITNSNAVNVYGGGMAANVSTTDIAITGSTISKNVYGGGEEGQVVNSLGDSTKVSMQTSHASNVYGGGKGANASVGGSTSVSIENSNIVSSTDETTGELINGNVFGGGDQGKVFADTLINITENTKVEGIVYGGGNRADVDGNTSVALDSSEAGSVFGGGNAGKVNGTGKVGNDNTISSTAVSIYASKVQNDVFGGGNEGEVTGNTNVLVSTITDTISTVGNAIYGGGKAANVNGTTVVVSKGTTAKNVFGGGDLGQVTTNTKVLIDNSEISNNVYGGGNGLAASTAGNPGQITGNVELVIRNEATVGNCSFGGGQGVTAVVNGDIDVTIESNSIVTNDAYGGGDNGPVNGGTSVYLTNANVGGNAYAAGNGTSALVKKNSYILSEGTTKVGLSIFGGGNAAETGDGVTDVLAIVDIAGGDIGGNVYGGANSSVIFGSTVVNVGEKAINDYYGEEKGFEKGKIHIAQTIYGGGEQMDPTKEFNYDTISVTGTILINVDGEGYETSATDTNTIDIMGDIFGSGNASSANTNGDINVRNYGARTNPKRGVSIQRATTVIIDNASLLLNGTTDSTSSHPDGLFSLNRIDNLIVKNNSTLFLVNGANLLGSYHSMLGEDGAEELAVVTIKDTVIGENGVMYEAINGNIYDSTGKEVEYYVNAGVVYRVTANPTDEDEIVTNVADIRYASTIDSNVDNRIYMYSGRNLNISLDEDVLSKYGEVKGMTFFGIFKSDSGSSSEEGNEGSSDSVYMGMYAPGYQTGRDVAWEERNFNRTYVLGLHEKSPEQDITKDGFYTVYDKLNFELGDNEYITEENYDATSYISYITPTPKDDVYYMWYAGPDDEVYYYTFTLTASKHSTFGTKELPLLGISYENAELTMTSVDASLNENIGLYDKSQIPNINTDQDAANNNFGLTMRTGNTGWSMVGATDFLADPINADNNTNNASFDGTTTYKIENLKTTPIFSFFLYHSNNITETKELGSYQINMNLSYWKDALNRGNARVIIDVVMLTEVFDDVGYNGAITPGSQYDLFTNTVTNVTTKSSFSTYFELAQPNFMQIENIQKYYDDSYRVITTEYAFPVDTTITMIDRWNRNNPEYYYYTVSEEDYAAGKVEYKFSEFKSMGSSNEPYDEEEVRENYYINENGMDYQYENFIFIVNFENAKFEGLSEEESLVIKDQHFRIFLKADVEGRTEILFGLLDDQIDSIIYGVYNTESTIDISAKLSKARVFLGNEVFLNVNTIYNVQKGEQAVTIYDTRYFDKKLGIKLTFSVKNDQGEYEQVNGANLLGTYFELNGEKYYPRADGTTRIKVADLVSNASSSILIGTENSTLATDEYKILIESFGSADGIYYGVEASASTEVELEIINDLYGLNSTLPEEQVIIDKATGYTLDKDLGITATDGANKLNFSIEYLSGLNNPYLTVSLYRRDYDETMADPYQNTYSLVDFSEYVSETLELPKEINQEYAPEDEEFIESIKIFKNEYKVLDTSQIWAAVTDPTISVTLNANYTLKQNLTSGTYKVVFRLYDSSETVVNKQEVSESGVVSEKPFNVTQYELIGDTFSYIIIK